MMTDAVKGHTREEARLIVDAFTKMMTDPELEPAAELGDLEAFQGVAKFPIRVKCATLAWRVLEEGLEQSDGNGTGKVELT
jgi:nitrogen fixation NifU-like protein